MALYFQPKCSLSLKCIQIIENCGLDIKLLNIVTMYKNRIPVPDKIKATPALVYDGLLYMAKDAETKILELAQKAKYYSELKKRDEDRKNPDNSTEDNKVVLDNLSMKKKTFDNNSKVETDGTDDVSKHFNAIYNPSSKSVKGNGRVGNIATPFNAKALGLNIKENGEAEILNSKDTN